MPSPPDEPCVVRKGERIEVTDDGWILPDGSTRETLDGCEIEAGASIIGLIEDLPKPRKRKVTSVRQPEPVSDVTVADEQTEADVVQTPPDAVSPDELHADTVELLPDPPKLPPEAASHAVVVSVAVAAVGAAGVAGVKALAQAVNGGGSNGSQGQEQQRKEEERKEREQCATASDGLVNDFRARVADFKTRKLPMPVDPAELWQRCDLLDEQADQLQRWMRARAKTRCA